MVQQGEKCSKARCSSRGTCVVDQFFFDKDYKNLDYTSIFKDVPCVCDAERMGNDCSKKYDLAAEELDKVKAKKLVNWTKVHISHFKTYINGYHDSSHM